MEILIVFHLQKALVRIVISHFFAKMGGLIPDLDVYYFLMISTPTYFRKTSGTTTEPSAS